MFNIMLIVAAIFAATNCEDEIGNASKTHASCFSNEHNNKKLKLLAADEKGATVICIKNTTNTSSTSRNENTKSFTASDKVVLSDAMFDKECKEGEDDVKLVIFKLPRIEGEESFWNFALSMGSKHDEILGGFHVNLFYDLKMKYSDKTEKQKFITWYQEETSLFGDIGQDTNKASNNRFLDDCYSNKEKKFEEKYITIITEMPYIEFSRFYWLEILLDRVFKKRAFGKSDGLDSIEKDKIENIRIKRAKLLYFFVHSQENNDSIFKNIEVHTKNLGLFNLDLEIIQKLWFQGSVKMPYLSKISNESNFENPLTLYLPKNQITKSKCDHYLSYDSQDYNLINKLYEAFFK